VNRSEPENGSGADRSDPALSDQPLSSPEMASSRPACLKRSGILRRRSRRRNERTDFRRSSVVSKGTQPSGHRGPGSSDGRQTGDRRHGRIRF
jgi:hypothetical protein